MSSAKTIRPLPKIVGRYFEAWITRRTCFKEHLIDDEFFYKFVKAVLRYCKQTKRPGDGEIRRLIELKGAKNYRDLQYLKKKARIFAARYACILQFDDTSFPDSLIERSSLILCYSALEKHGYSTSQIEQAMRNLFGDDWKKQMEKEKTRHG